MKTEKLYYQDHYLKSCQSHVVGIIDIDAEHSGLVLDRTCFFPRGGGAAGDTGKIDSVLISEVVYDRENEVAVHPIDVEHKATFAIGAQVICEIDWNRRFQVMKLHSASHIMEHFLFFLVPGLELIGTNVNENRDSSTYSGPEITTGILENLNQLSNEFIRANHEIRTYPSKDDPSYRFWGCGDIVMPCGGVHPKRTMDIGNITIRKEKGGKRQKIRTELSQP